MARKARPNSRTLVRFIAPDDSAIGLNESEFNAGYDKYMQTLNEEHLKLKEDETPSYYYARPITVDLLTKTRDLLAVAADAEASTSAEKLMGPEGKLVLREFVDRCVVGCTAHPTVESIKADGSFIEKNYAWEVGTMRPDGFVDAILSDDKVIYNLFWFTFSASQLTDDEKKR